MTMERIKQLHEYDIALEEVSDVVFIGEFAGGGIRNLIPIEKLSIPALIEALKKYVAT